VSRRRVLRPPALTPSRSTLWSTTHLTTLPTSSHRLHSRALTRAPPAAALEWAVGDPLGHEDVGGGEDMWFIVNERPERTYGPRALSASLVHMNLHVGEADIMSTVVTGARAPTVDYPPPLSTVILFHLPCRVLITATYNNNGGYEPCGSVERRMTVSRGAQQEPRPSVSRLTPHPPCRLLFILLMSPGG
jgi:hypothetical protein